jgi:hypothetical protein
MPRIPSYIENLEKQHEQARLSKVGRNGEQSGVDDWLSKILGSLDKTYNRLASIINGQLSFGNGTDSDNIDGVWVSVLTPTPGDTDFTVTHNLGRLPVGYILMEADLPSLIYTGSVAATTTEITLRNATDGANIVLFIV